MYVIKVGGSKGIDYDAFADDLAALVAAGTRFVLVHGGSAELNELSTRLGRPPRMITSVSGFESRYTDAETMDLFAMVYAGKMNKRIVERLWQRGVKAVGLSGADGGIWRGPRKKAIKIIEQGKKRIIRDDCTGKVERVETALLLHLLDVGMLPVLTPPALSDDGELINVDGDRAAAATAVALRAQALLVFSNVPGLLRDVEDPSSLVRSVDKGAVESALSLAKGRFRKKILGVMEALAGGVERVVLADARYSRPVKRALAGEGTVIS